ncbi:hypothetical protein EGR_06335 [Echinococcus granulosus]|uniref:Uncharacterized protein n=1 Tax=Echinococcus granulosus TaxID=6210 RepID=W6UD96_ECHGR|nr:hypothetical protein EGR_06335 [Echinococcus granulosus]EUB58786.1 hypothetical protein EGR_06335 [Echinococcus granulosus]
MVSPETANHQVIKTAMVPRPNKRNSGCIHNCQPDMIEELPGWFWFQRGVVTFDVKMGRDN